MDVTRHRRIEYVITLQPAERFPVKVDQYGTLRAMMVDKIEVSHQERPDGGDQIYVWVHGQRLLATGKASAVRSKQALLTLREVEKIADQFRADVLKNIREYAEMPEEWK